MVERLTLYDKTVDSMIKGLLEVAGLKVQWAPFLMNGSAPTD